MDPEARTQALKDFGARLRELRHEAGLTQEQLAEKADLHWTFIGQVERGERNLSLINILKLSDALEVAAPALLCKRTQ